MFLTLGGGRRNAMPSINSRISRGIRRHTAISPPRPLNPWAPADLIGREPPPRGPQRNTRPSRCHRQRDPVMGFPRNVEASLLGGRRWPRQTEVDREFRAGAVRIVRETGKPIAQVARELGINRARWGTGSRPDRRARERATGR